MKNLLNNIKKVVMKKKMYQSYVQKGTYRIKIATLAYNAEEARDKFLAEHDQIEEVELYKK